MTITQVADREAFYEFGLQRHWKIERGADGRGDVASRKFRYRCGAVAALWAERPDDTRRLWGGHLGLQFAAGPEASHAHRRFPPVRDWLVSVETVLKQPLQIEQASSWAAAERALKTIGRHKGWWVIALALEIDLADMTPEGVCARLLELEAGHLDQAGRAATSSNVTR